MPISAIIFGGRRARLAPLVYESRDWQHGVFVGATMASETTAAATGAVGVTRRDPMAMLPFCGYNMADYFRHWLEMGPSIKHPPKIFHVNWFRKDANGKFLWPGYGENVRVLKWMLDRIEGRAAATETPIGYVPTPGSLTLDGLAISRTIMDELLRVDAARLVRRSRRPRNSSKFSATVSPPKSAAKIKPCRIASTAPPSPQSKIAASPHPRQAGSLSVFRCALCALTAAFSALNLLPLFSLAFINAFIRFISIHQR